MKLIGTVDLTGKDEVYDMLVNISQFKERVIRGEVRFFTSCGVIFMFFDRIPRK